MTAIAKNSYSRSGSGSSADAWELQVPSSIPGSPRIGVLEQYTEPLIAPDEEVGAIHFMNVCV